MDEVESRMKGITYANDYTREVGASRVFNANRLPQNLPTPSIVILQGAESVTANVGDRYECILSVSIGFVDAYAGKDPDVEANEFLADVQTAFTNGDIVFSTTSAATSATVSSAASILEVSNSLNAGEPMDGKVFGEITYEIQYYRAVTDPRKI